MEMTDVQRAELAKANPMLRSELKVCINCGPVEGVVAYSGYCVACVLARRLDNTV